MAWVRVVRAFERGQSTPEGLLRGLELTERRFDLPQLREHLSHLAVSLAQGIRSDLNANWYSARASSSSSTFFNTVPRLNAWLATSG